GVLAMVGDSFDVLAIQQPLARWEDVADVGCNGLIAASGVEVGVLPGSDDGRVQFAFAPVGSRTGAGGESRCVPVAGFRLRAQRRLVTLGALAFCLGGRARLIAARLCTIRRRTAPPREGGAADEREDDGRHESEGEGVRSATRGVDRVAGRRHDAHRRTHPVSKMKARLPRLPNSREWATVWPVQAWTARRNVVDKVVKAIQRGGTQFTRSGTRVQAQVERTPDVALLLGNLLERGDTRSLDAILREADEQSLSDPKSPFAWFHCLRSILDGDAAKAEGKARALYAEAGGRPDALALYTTHLGLSRWMQGRSDGVEEALLSARREHPEVPLWPVALAWLWLHQGRTSSSEQLLRTVPELDALPADRY